MQQAANADGLDQIISAGYFLRFGLRGVKVLSELTGLMMEPVFDAHLYVSVCL